ncbi:MAG TPA: hypothetical protein VNY73_10610 [Bacteroidia bacterium]|nr:hypothetical protein [Bacteroidia bacterium]
MRFLLFIVLVLGFSSYTDDDVIVWSKNRPLTWNDYKGKPQRRFAAASTVYSLGRKVLNENGVLIARIQAYFYCNDSWKKDDWINESVLAHEQKHFDIVELFCRRMRKQVTVMTFIDQKDAEHKVDSLYEIYNAEMDIYQDKYDDESDGSMSSEGQKKWSNKISKEIEALAAYEQQTIRLKLK